MSRLTIILFIQNLTRVESNISMNIFLQPKKDMSVAAPIMHPIFGASDPNQVPPANNMMNPNVMPGQNQYDQSYGTAPPTQMQPNAPMSIMNPTNFYQPQQQQQQQQQMQDNSNMINYQNFNSFVGAPQQQQQQEMPVQPPVQEVVKEKPPLPEEFIYLQTVLEELKSQCINRATNPVSFTLTNYKPHSLVINVLFFIAANEA